MTAADRILAELLARLRSQIEKDMQRFSNTGSKKKEKIVPRLHSAPPSVVFVIRFLDRGELTLGESKLTKKEGVMRNRNVFLATALLAGLIANQTAARAEKYGSVAGAACVPWDTTVAAAKWQTNYGGVDFKTGQNGSISFACPVIVPSDTYTPNLYYSNDGDGSTNNYNVQAQFRKRNKSTGADSTICTEVSSGGSGDDCSQIAIDNDTYQYYVYVTVSRTGNTHAIRFNGIDFDIYTP